MKHLRFPFILAVFVIGISSAPMHAQEVYTRLTDHRHVQVFNNVSNRLVCQCGCHFLLSQCPHVECPWGIPARDFIEQRILEGQNADQIVVSMEKGFGGRYEKDAFVRRLREDGREDLAEGFIRGFGRQVRSDTSSGGMAFLVAAFVVLAGFASFWWIRRNRASASQKDQSAPTKADQPSTLLDKFKDLDR